MRCKKSKIFIFAIATVLLLTGSQLTLAVKIQNGDNNQDTSKLTTLDFEEEIYYIYGANFADNGPGSAPDREFCGDHNIHLSPGLGECYVVYEFDIQCSSLGVSDFDIGVNHKNSDEQSEIYLYNFVEDSWNLIDETMGEAFKDEFEWWWASENGGLPQSSDQYIKNRGKVKIKIHAADSLGHGEDTIVERVAVKFTDNEETDQSQTTYESSSKSVVTQLFIPTFEKLTRVKLLFKPTETNPNSPANQVTFKILDKNNIKITPTTFVGVPVKFECLFVAGPEKWVEFDVDDTQLIPNEEYYIYVLITNGFFEICKDAEGNICYKTYGEETTDDYNPELNLSKDEINGFSSQHPDYSVDFEIQNIGDEGSCFEWSLTVIEGQDWIVIDGDTSGVLYNENGGNSYGWKTMYVSVDYSGMDGDRDGETYIGKIKVEAPALGQEKTINVETIVYESRAKSKNFNLLANRLIDIFPVLKTYLDIFF